MAWLRERSTMAGGLWQWLQEKQGGGTEISKQWSMYEDHWWPLTNDTKDDLVLC